MATEKRERQRAAREERLARESKQAKRRKSVRQGIIIAVVAAVVVGTIYLFTHKSSSSSANTTTTSAAMTPTTAHGPATPDALAQAKANKIAVAAGCPSSPTARVNTMSWSSAPAMTIDTAKVYTALINTDLGPFTITLDAKSAPVTTNNFVFLAQHGYYHCIIFHRVIPGFVVQSGGFTTGMNPVTSSLAPIALETPNGLSNTMGTLAMARTSDPNSATSQFYVNLADNSSTLDYQSSSNPGYAVFGYVSSGMDVINQIAAVPTTTVGSYSDVPVNDVTITSMTRTQ